MKKKVTDAFVELCKKDVALNNAMMRSRQLIQLLLQTPSFLVTNFDPFVNDVPAFSFDRAVKAPAAAKPKAKRAAAKPKVKAEATPAAPDDPEAEVDAEEVPVPAPKRKRLRRIKTAN